MPFTFVKIISTPRPSKGRSYFEIQFDKYGNWNLKTLDCYTKFLQEAVSRDAVAQANRKKYRFDGNKNRKKYAMNKIKI